MNGESLNLNETTDPYAVFARWFDEAKASEPNDPSAMALASVDTSGLPDVRMVLMKDFDERGFVFYTNLQSAKGRELLATRAAALCFHWKSSRRQVRARGEVELVSVAEADAYYASRPRGSRVGAWASAQSRPLDARRTLEARVEAVEGEHPEAMVPRPPHWSGFRLKPIEIELWSDGAFRLHDRFRFTRPAAGGPWSVMRLYP